MSKKQVKIKKTKEQYRLRATLERVRRIHEADMAANDMSDPQEPLDPYFDPLPTIGQSDLLRIRDLYKQTFPGGDHNFNAAYLSVVDAAGVVVETNSPTRAMLFTELLAFAARISKG